jgi:hypothetical protein
MIRILTPRELVAQWRKTDLAGCADAREHFLELCRLMGHPTPAQRDSGYVCLGQLQAASLAVMSLSAVIARSMGRTMKALTVGTVLVSIALLAFACGSQERATDPVSVVQDFFDKVNAGDLDGAMAYVPEGATYLAWDVLAGKEQIAAYYEGEIGRNILCELSDIEVEGSEVRFRSTGTSNLVTFEDEAWRVVVEDGMLISLRYSG